MKGYKVLLDENIPIDFRKFFSSKDEVKTVEDMDWKGKSNGVLLKLMVKYKFDVFITNDKNLSYQNQLEGLPIAVFVLDSPDNKKITLLAYIKEVIKRLKKGIVKEDIIWTRL